MADRNYFGMPENAPRGRKPSKPQVLALLNEKGKGEAFGVRFKDSEHKFPKGVTVVEIPFSYAAAGKAVKEWATTNKYKVLPCAKAYGLTK